jgi:NAD(P)-dependent dehydrogenase (short-subunit alcohol dehydrogenase family)
MTTVLITGSNSGIGRSTAVRLAREGQRVYAAMRDTGKADKLLSLAQEVGAELTPIALDVNDPASVTRAAEQVTDEAGGVEVLINNAGVGMNATVEDVEIDSAKSVFETNYWGVIRCIQAVLPAMRERGAGHIINVSSVAGRLASPAQTIYSSSKWALECLSENLVHEVAPFGIRVSVIEPGVTRTAILPKNIGHPEPTAYETIYRRMLQFYAKGIEANVPADDVADTIWQAMNDPKPRFRYPCSWGGEEISAGRAKMTDEEWVALGRFEADDDYYVAFASHFGLDLK